MKKFTKHITLITIAVMTNVANAANWKDDRDTAWPANMNASPLVIESERQLAQFAYLVNQGNFGNRTVVLQKDLNLSGKDWTPIGASHAFMGTFDGQGYAIRNLKIDSWDNLSTLDVYARRKRVCLHHGRAWGGRLLE